MVLVLVILSGITCVNGQNPVFTFFDDIQVIHDGAPLALPWAGGLDAPQVNRMDMNADGREDVILFDRTSFSLMVFLNTAIGLQYAPELTDQFPEGIEHWMLLRDFNGDGRKDLFTSSPLGMVVYVNEPDEEGISWRIYHERPAGSPLMTTGFNGSINLQVNATDIPGISDLDGDGDLDILVFRFTSISTIEWHRNMAIEQTGSLDSMLFVRETQRWGDFEECDCGVFAYTGETCDTAPGKVEHAGGKTILTLDWAGDGDMDLLMSEESCFDLYLLENNGERMIGVLKEYTENIPFPGAYYEDVDMDGISDLVIASNIQSSSQVVADFSRTIRYYRNLGSDAAPQFETEASPYLQDQMIDIGSGAAPAFHDIDNDGDLDLFVGNRYGNFEEEPAGIIRFYENTGNRSQPEFTWRENDFLNISSLGLHNIQPQFRDIDRDGLTDLLFLADDSNDERKLYVLRQLQGGFTDVPYVLFDGFFPFDTYAMNYVDEDNILDLVITRAAGSVAYYRGSFAGETLELQLETSEFLGLGNNPLRTRGRLILADINHNLINDAVYTYANGEVFWSPDIDLSSDAVFQPLPLEGLGQSPFFGSYLWLEPVSLFGDRAISLMAGTGRGGLQLLRGEPGSSSGEDFTVYPNPLVKNEGGILNISTSLPVQLSVVNLLGQEVRTYEGVSAGIHQVDLWDLPAGLYLLIGRNSGDVVVSRRIVVME